MSRVDFLSVVFMAALAAVNAFLLIKSQRAFAVVRSVMLTSLVVALSGIPLMLGLASLNVRDQFIIFLLLATHEEAVRLIFILLLFSKPTHVDKAVWRVLLAFGFTFGFVEFLLNFGATIWVPGKCAESVAPLSCSEGFYYLVFAHIEPLIFHALICWMCYSQMDFSRKLSWNNFVVFAAIVVFHGTTNFLRTLHPWGTASFDSLVYTPLSYLVLYAVMAVLSLRMRSDLKVIS